MPDERDGELLRRFDEIDLDAGPKRQRGGPDRRAGGKGLTEILCVDAIHRGEVTHTREKHTGAHDIIETLAGRLGNRREVLGDALRPANTAPPAHLASTRSLRDRSAQPEIPTHLHSPRKQSTTH